MGYIYTVSNNYLETLYEQTQIYKYIDVLGYRSVKKATSLLHLTNNKDILGYLYLDDQMPPYPDMMRFIRKIELTLDKSKILLIVVRDKDSYEEFLNQYTGSLVKIRAIVGFEVLTDTIIRNAIGTIYSTQASPYLDINEENDNIVRNPDYLKYNKVIPSKITDLISPVHKLNNVIETERYDVTLARIRDKDSFENEYRKAFIQRSYSRKYPIMQDSPYDECLTMALKELLKEEMENE